MTPATGQPRTLGIFVEAVPPRVTVAVGLVIAVGAALPLLVSVPAPLQDWPNHLGRVHILDELLRGVGPWGTFYEFNSFLIPNVALDFGVLALLRCGMSLAVAGALFLLATYALFVTGFTRMSSSFGASHPGTPMLAALLFYNSALFYGLLNYLAGLGLLFWGIALWIRAKRPALRAGIAILVAAATFLCHIVSAALLVGLLGLLDLSTLMHTRKHSVFENCTSLAAAATVLVLLKLSPTGNDNLFSLAYVGTESAQGFFYWKASLFLKALLSGSFWSDIILAAFGATLALSILATARIGFSGPELIILMAVTLLPILAPYLVGAGSLLDYRLAPSPFIFAGATARLRWRFACGPALVFSVLSLCVIIRSALLAESWREARHTYAEADAAFATLPPRSVLLAVRGHPLKQVSWADFWTPPVSHLHTLAVQHEVIVPSVFAYRSQQPLALRSHAQAWSEATDADTPERLNSVLTRARLLCPNNPGVFVAALYPAPFMKGAAVRAVNDRLSIIDACAPQYGLSEG
ncbi:MAG: hypothetical protein JOY71_24175 [Acetobacteraceae bacterium]|nr:hypothetical protein [Acetobacteraceae bacterium]